MIILFLITAIIGLIFGSVIGHVAPLCFASLYVLVMAQGVFSGGRELDKEKLREGLKNGWHRSNEIVEFIVKYWYSIKYVRSAKKRGSNASAIGIGSLLLAAWYFYAYPNWMGTWSLINGIFLWVIGNKVNKALYVLNHEQQSPTWDTACASFLALSEVLSDPIYSTFVNEHMPAERVTNVIHAYKNKGSTTFISS